MPSVFGALRRRLLARPGITATPRCPACTKETAPKDFDLRSGLCKYCEFERAQEYVSRAPDTMIDDGRDFE